MTAELLQVTFWWCLAVTFPLVTAKKKIPSVVCKATTRGSRILRLLVAADHMLVAVLLVFSRAAVSGQWSGVGTMALGHVCRAHAAPRCLEPSCVTEPLPQWLQAVWISQARELSSP